MSGRKEQKGEEKEVERKAEERIEQMSSTREWPSILGS